MFWYSRPKDKRYRRDFARLELARLKFRFFFSLSDLDVLQNRFCHFKFARSLISKKSRLTKIQTRCLLTLRSRAVYNRFKLSRLQVKKLGASGLIMGLRRGIW